MTNPHSAENRLLIDGTLQPALSGKTYNNISPTTAQVVGDAADATVDDAELAITAARRAFDETDWSTNHALRKKCLEQLKAGLEALAPELREQVMLETGATRAITVQGPQCDTPISFIQYYIDLIDQFDWEEDLPTTESMGVKSARQIWKEAAGVVSAITPWNFPVQINLAKIIPALAAGCTVILKAAPHTPCEATAIGKVVAESTDFPPGVINILTSEEPAAIGEMLSSDPRIDVVSFTGSTQVGRRIMELAAPTVKKVFLELGGKSANIILDDADFMQALQSCFYVTFHAGQGCALATRMLIPKSRYEEAVQILQGYFAHVGYGDPENLEQIMGPVVSQQQRQRVLALIQKGVEEGARIAFGGNEPEGLDGFYVEPTLFVDVTEDMTIAQEEIFGPVLCVIPYEDDEDAVRIANNSIYGLSGSIIGNPDRAMAMARKIRTGTMNINGANFYSADAPFGGYKQSGIGRESGVQGFEEFLETKTVAMPAG